MVKAIALVHWSLNIGYFHGHPQLVPRSVHKRSQKIQFTYLLRIAATQCLHFWLKYQDVPICNVINYKIMRLAVNVTFKCNFNYSIYICI